MSSFSDWMAATGGSSGMGLDDPHLDDRTLELQRRHDDLLAEGRRLDKALTDALTAWREATGTGEAEGGAVKVVVDAQNRLVDVILSPRALRLGSTDRLRTALLDANALAVADVAQQVRTATGLADDADPLTGFLESMPEVTAVLPYEVRNPQPRDRPDPPQPEKEDDDARDRR